LNHAAKVPRSVRHPCTGNKKILAANEDNNAQITILVSLLRKEKSIATPSKSRQTSFVVKDFLDNEAIKREF
jgi:hypothetical protein